MFSALVDSRRGGFMPCGLGKSWYLLFYFVKNHEDDFSLLFLRFPTRDKTFFLPNYCKNDSKEKECHRKA